MSVPWTQRSQLILTGSAVDRLGLPHRVYVPDQLSTGDPAHKHSALIMVHGVDGNEDAPWVFARAASPNWLVISPRAPLFTGAEPGNLTQFSWYRSTLPGQPIDPVAFADGLRALTRFIAEAAVVYPIDPARVVLLGFSQGAALSYAYTAYRYSPRTIADPPLLGLAVLAGFIPLPIARLPALDGLPALILHGTLDERVPLIFAQEARDRLATAGALVTYEESPIGHKVSATGMRTLTAWLAQRL